ncbi:MAG: RING finger domain-containing protein [Chlamydiota bacterium]
MSVSFSKTTVFNPKENCAICHDFLEKSEVVVHGGNDGEKHPVHKNCIMEWVKRNPSCPICRARVTGNSLFSWKERALIVIKNTMVIVLVLAATVERDSVSFVGKVLATVVAAKTVARYSTGVIARIAEVVQLAGVTAVGATITIRMGIAASRVIIGTAELIGLAVGGIARAILRAV